MGTVLMVMFDGVQSLDVTGPLEVFSGANYWRARHNERNERNEHNVHNVHHMTKEHHVPDKRHVPNERHAANARQVPDAGNESEAAPAPYNIRTASLGGRSVRTSSGLRLMPDGDLRDEQRQEPGLLIVPGGAGARRADPELVAWLRTHGGRARRLVSVCTGAFLLAEAGLLDGRRVTTHWAYCDALAARFPQLKVDPDPIFVRDGNLATSAGVTAGIDLALELVEEDLGREAALDIARYLVVFLRRPANQAQFSAQLAGQLASRDALRDVQRWIADHPGADLSVPTLANQASLSPRQFARAFAAEVGMPPGRYVDRVRLEAARRRLEDTQDGVEQTAVSCGYGTPEGMRRAFVRTLGVGPDEYRRRFRPANPAGPANPANPAKGD